MNRIPINLIHAFPGLMVRSRDLEPCRTSNLLRGVSNHGAAPSFETAATLRLCALKANALAPSSATVFVVKRAAMVFGP
jgi:hypothetical protein